MVIRILFILVFFPSVAFGGVPIFLGLAGSGGPDLPDCYETNTCTCADTACRFMSVHGMFDDRWFAPGSFAPQYNEAGLITGIPDMTQGRITDLYRLTGTIGAVNWSNSYLSLLNIVSDKVDRYWESVPYPDFQSSIRFHQQLYKGTVQIFTNAHRLYCWDGDSWYTSSFGGSKADYNGVETRSWPSVVADFGILVAQEDWYVGEMGIDEPSNPEICGWQASLGPNIYAQGEFNDGGIGGWRAAGSNVVSSDVNGACTAAGTPDACCSGNATGTCVVGDEMGSLKITQSGADYLPGAEVTLSGNILDDSVRPPGAPSDYVNSLTAGAWYRLVASIRMGAYDEYIRFVVEGADGELYNNVDVLSATSVGVGNIELHITLNEVMIEFEAGGSNTLKILGSYYPVDEADPRAHTWDEVWIDNIELYEINP